MNLERYLRKQRTYLEALDNSIKNCKLALFDFDDTLIIHNNHDTYKDPGEHKYGVDILKGEYDWSNGMANRHMKEMMELLKSQGTQLGLISATFSFQHMQAKQEHIKEIYEIELENYCVGAPKNKVQLLEYLAEAKGVKKREIMIVDDRYDIQQEAANNGFIALAPLQVGNYIEWQDNKE